MEQKVFTDSRCAEHRAPYGFPECPERLESVLARLRGLWEVSEAPPHAAGRDAILAVHEPIYVQAFEHAVARGDGLLGSADNPLSPGTWNAACGAVDATLYAADWIMGAGAGEGREAFVAVRPPGHHAEHELAMGFCFFNNIAVGAEYLIRAHHLDRVAILDFDVHHGNGSQHLFETRSDIHYSSVHQWPLYPGTGAAGETGVGEGEGATLNVPLPAGSGDEDYQRVFEETLLPALADFRPDALLLSAGFDAWARDPVGGMRVSAAAFGAFGDLLRDFAGRHCHGRMLSALEGGYDLEALPGLVARYLSGADEQTA